MVKSWDDFENGKCVRSSVRDVLVIDENGLTYCPTFFTAR